MAYKVLISPRVRDDLKSIVRYINLDNQQAALGLGHSLIEKALSLEDQPLRGRIVPEFGVSSVRELVFRPYRIIYEFSADSRVVEILRFWHAARGTPKFGNS